jgi:hypothetical protein
MIQELRQHFERFAEALPQERRMLFERLFEAAPRYHARHHLTIVHGDAHVWNCFLPRDGGDDVRLSACSTGTAGALALRQPTLPT